MARTKSTSESTLVEIKFRPPTAPHGEITRHDALQLLEDHSTQSMCLIGAAGSGKSTFLRQLYDGILIKDQTCVWLNIDGRDNDPAHFAPYMLDAIDRLTHNVSPLNLRPFDFDDEESLKRSFELMQLAVSQLNGKHTLFLDDFHLIKSKKILEQFQYFLDACTNNLQVIIGARRLPDLDIPRRILSGQFMSVPDGFLTFTRQETEDFFEHYGMPQLTPDDISNIQRSTEGWIAGMQFTAIALQNAPNKKANLIANVVRKDEYISEYLTANVLETQPKDLQEFLLKTAPLERFNASLCAYVTKISNIEEKLEDLKKKNLFLIHLGGDGNWYRYHHLFADFLKAEFQRRHPDEWKTILSAASKWYVSHDLVDEAIECLLEIENYSEAANLISEIGIEVTRDRGDHGKLLRWVSSLPKSYRQHHPRLILASALALGFSRGAEEAKHILETLKDLLSKDTALESFSQEEMDEYLCYAEVIHILLLAAEERTLQSDQDIYLWETKWPNPSEINASIVLNVKAYNSLVNNRFENSIRAARDSRFYALQSTSPYVSTWSDCLTAMAHIASGDPDTAKAFVDRASKEALDTIPDYTLLSLMIPLLAAQIAYERGNLSEAFSELTHGIGFGSTFGPVEPLIIAYKLQAQMHKYKNDYASAHQILDQGLGVAISQNLPRLLTSMIAELITLNLENGEIKKAKMICDEWGILDKSWMQKFGIENPYVINNLKRIEIEMALAEKDYNKANMMCQTFRQNLAVSCRPRSLIRAGILKSLALRGLGEKQKSWREMTSTIKMARPNQLVSSFIELKSYCLPIIHEIIESRHLGQNNPNMRIETSEDWLLSILNQDRIDQSQETSTDIAADQDHDINLTPRELEMLQLASTGCSNAMIAENLLVSVPTVKWHLHNAFQKLDVNSRTAALVKARDLGILSDH